MPLVSIQSLMLDARDSSKMMQVWMSFLTTGDRVAVSALQRLSALLPSSAPVEEKLKAASIMAESLTQKLSGDAKVEAKSKLNLVCA